MLSVGVQVALPEGVQLEVPSSDVLEKDLEQLTEAFTTNSHHLCPGTLQPRLCVMSADCVVTNL